MPAEYKLLEVLRTIKEELGELSTAWFTTYSLDPLIVENYVLPELLELERPKDIYDYEALTTRYAESEMDIRFFYDPGALITTNQKRTSIPFFPAAASGFGSRFRGGVFHPKVWYIRSSTEGKGKGRAVLLVTSANLSISGWAENREAFLLREVTDGENASRLRGFFRHCFRASGLDTAGIDEAFQGVGTEEDEMRSRPRWRFVYTQTERREAFLDSLLPTENGGAELLSVWSPYWAQDVPSLVERLHEKAGGKIELEFYPDFVARNQPRFSKEQLEIMRDRGNVDYFFRDPQSADPERFSHAKIWRTGEVFAVGSWNCTHAALDLRSVEEGEDMEDPGTGTQMKHPSNMEAGIVVYTEDPAMLPKRPEPAELIGIASLEAASVEDTEEELPSHRAMPPLRVFFDWSERRYELQWDDASSFSPSQWCIRLPGLGGARIVGDLLGQCPALLPNQANELISSRLCSLWRKDRSDQLFYLYVAEQGVKGKYRPSLRYRDLDELFRHLQTQTRTDTIGDMGGGTLNVPPESVHSVDESAFEEETLREGGDVASSYFVLFRAFHNKGKDIEMAKNRNELRMSVEIAPGNLFEIWDHIESVIFDGEEERRELRKRLYTYFLLREYSILIERVFTRAEELNSIELEEEEWLSELSRIGKQAEELRLEVERHVASHISDDQERKAMLAMMDEVYGEDYVGEA